MSIITALTNASLPARRFVGKHDSTILTVITMTATGAAVFFALKDGPKAKKILDAKKKEGANNVETAKAVLPVCARTMMAVAVAWGSAVLNHKRCGDKIIALTEALSVANSLREDTKKATVETVGPEKAEEIEKKVATNRATQQPVVLSEVENTGHGTFIFREPMTGKTFRASKDFVELVVSKYSSELTKHFLGIHGDSDYARYADEDFEISMSDIFEDIGLSHCGFADLFTWPAREFDSIDVNISNTFEYEGPDGNMEPGYILDFYTKPILAYSSYSAGSGRRY